MNKNYMFRLTDGLTKARLKDKFEDFAPYHNASALQGDRLFFSGIYTAAGTVGMHHGIRTTVRIRSALKKYITVYAAENVPVILPHYPDRFDEDYLMHEPGLMPDLLEERKEAYFSAGLLQQLVFDLRVPKDFPAGIYPVTVALIGADGKQVAKDTLTVEILNAVLPEQELVVAQWMHCDCIATYYGVKVFSEKHWKLIENYMKVAVEGGINCILVPVLTPPLDTAVGGERPTVQLVDVTVNNGKYTFGFEKLKRFLDICHRTGVKELEINHFFTQWGAEHAPKVIATVDGVKKRIFGWETAASGKEYAAFLKELIPQLKEKLDEFGYRDRYFFHISDEPSKKHLESYNAARSVIYDLVCDHPLRDALSSFEFYKSGVVNNPIVSTNHAEEFIENKVPGLWAYYCCSQSCEVSNRFLAMPGYRNRVLGAQLYRSDIAGFLQWGYNYYYSQYSNEEINPFLRNDGRTFTPGGDTFEVYPGRDGKPQLSLHFVQFMQALLDHRALKAAETKIGREAVLKEIGEEIKDLKTYPKNNEYLLSLRERINRIIAK